MNPSGTVIVSGASVGLGVSVTTAFAKASWTTVGIARSERPAEYPDTADYLQGDAADPEVARALVDQIDKTYDLSKGTLCLINCAGQYVRGSILDVSGDQIVSAVQSNYLAPAVLTHALLMKASKGSIVNVISTSALQAKATNSLYGSAKAGLAQFFRSLQAEFSSDQWRITNLYPETIRTHGEGPEVSAIEPKEFSEWILDVVSNPRSYYLSEVTVMPCE
jgi:NAD(P)-dependent dehydrogenase (short-subunit alcohol dehydrogenase family)